MAYAVKPVTDTWLKLSTAQGSTLPDSQRQFVASGTLLPVSSFELVGNDHIKLTLGKDAQGNQVQFKGRNTWYIYRPAVQILNNGKPVALPPVNSTPTPTPTPTPRPVPVPVPTPAPIPTSATWLKPLTDTWLKTSTEQGSLLSEDQKQFIPGNQLLPITSYIPVENDHIKITLGKDMQGNQVQFKGRNTWYVYRPSVQLLTNDQVVSPPTPSPAPIPAPIPTPTPPSSGLVLQTLIDTWLKTSPVQGSTLSDQERQFVSNNSQLPLASYESAANDHLKISLGQDNQGNQVQFKGRNSWYVYRPAVQVLRDGQLVPIPAPTPTPVPSPTPAPTSTTGQINRDGLRLLKSFEGLRLKAYQDSVGVWTIGYGTTSGVRPGMVITEAQAEELLKRDLDRFEQAVSELVTVPLTDDQFSALVTFTYNVGEGSLADSTLLGLLNQGDYQGAADQFLRWDKAGGQALPGLTRRRRAERALFLGQDYTVFL